MIVYDFNVVRVSVMPAKADPPLIVDANAVLALSVLGKLLQPIARRHSEVCQSNGPVQHPQFSEGRSHQTWRDLPGEFPAEEPFRGLVFEVPDHAAII